MKLPNYWKVKPIKTHFEFDTDRDGVIDYQDCQPFNPLKQDVEASVYNMEKKNSREQEPLHIRNIKDKPDLISKIKKSGFAKKGDLLVLMYGRPSRTKTQFQYIVDLSLNNKYDEIEKYLEEIDAFLMRL